MGAVDLAHPTFSDTCTNLVRAEFVAGREGHVSGSVHSILRDDGVFESDSLDETARAVLGSFRRLTRSEGTAISAHIGNVPVSAPFAGLGSPKLFSESGKTPSKLAAVAECLDLTWQEDKRIRLAVMRPPGTILAWSALAWSSASAQATHAQKTLAG
jgi:hypothetical protein